MHIDDFIDDPRTDVYASWFFMLMRFPAVLKYKFKNILDNYRLFCVYEGKIYRVTGCSRLGDVWLVEDFSRDSGYDRRVDVNECSDWSNVAEPHH